MKEISEEMRAFENFRDDEDEDPTKSSPTLGYDSDQEDYDSDGNPMFFYKKAIPDLDHSSIEYVSFKKDFYESISGTSEKDVVEYRKTLDICVSGLNVPKPIKTFEECSFSQLLMNAIAKPTPIQSQAMPIVLSGRDIIGMSKTAYGKTAAFVLPMIVHIIMNQPILNKGEGPIGVICAPTRELAHQIYLEANFFAKSQGLRVSALYDGMSKLENFNELKAGCDIVVATLRRLIDMLKMKALNISKATYLVLDEADRMFDLGFELQIRSIVGQIRPDR